MYIQQKTQNLRKRGIEEPALLCLIYIIMKTRPLLTALGMLLLSVLALPSAHAQQNAEAQKAYNTAKMAEHRGDVDTALANYEKALKLNPRHADAQFRRGQLKLNRDKIVARAQERKLSGIMVAEYRVDDASFKDAIKALGIHIENATKDTEQPITPNFIIQDPNSTLASRKVTLNMKNVPSGEILNYLLEMTKAKARYDKHAVVIMPR